MVKNVVICIHTLKFTVNCALSTDPAFGSEVAAGRAAAEEPRAAAKAEGEAEGGGGGAPGRGAAVRRAGGSLDRCIFRRKFMIFC